jgi:hypothetical protein
MLTRISAALLAFILAGMMPLRGQDQFPTVGAAGWRRVFFRFATRSKARSDTIPTESVQNFRNYTSYLPCAEKLSGPGSLNHCVAVGAAALRRRAKTTWFLHARSGASFPC